jgi:hypothetical protein
MTDWNFLYHAKARNRATLRWAADNPYLQKLNELRHAHRRFIRVRNPGSTCSKNWICAASVVQLGNPNQRLDNLDRLRRYALDYESACNRLHAAASLGGFLLVGE